ncbi:MAG TPA: hypothetical protein VGI39_19940 [Polyangiaceae bacterium]|jgi:hypothetical protein
MTITRFKPLMLPLSVASLVAFAACSAGPTDTSSSPAPGPSSPSGSSSSSALTLTLTGDGTVLHLDGAPADASYSATYHLKGFTSMNVAVNHVGDLAAICGAGGGQASCSDLPFFAQVHATGQIEVYDLYGHKVINALPTPGDAGLFGGTGPAFDASAPTLPPLPPVAVPDAGSLGTPVLPDAGGAGSIAASCGPSVTASMSGCSLTVNGTTCDCSDVSCTQAAIEACVQGLLPPGVTIPSGFDAGVPSFGDAGLGAPGLPPGIPTFGDGGTSSACSASDVSAAQQQFCSDVDAALTAAGISATLDCSALDTLTFPSAPPSTLNLSQHCGDLTHDALVKARTALATCNPLDYVGWDSSARLQLFEDGVCID